MKSIKEKAEETYPKTTATSDLCNEKFVEGANYVVEQLEEFLNLYGVYCITSSGKDYLKDMIEQLKK